MRNLIKNRLEKFWGYGNLKSDIWFIGMEEGFDGSLNDLKDRFKQTNNKCVIDLKNDTKLIKDHSKWFKEKARLQNTWKILILILLYLKNRKIPDNEEIREFQINKLGRLDSDHVLLELMPLPSKSTKNKDWIYHEYGIDYLRNRKEYLKKIMPERINSLRNLIRKYSPRIVIFYSFSYLKYWEQVIQENFEKNGDIYAKKLENTNYFVIKHPGARGLSNEYWQKVSKIITSFV